MVAVLQAFAELFSKTRVYSEMFLQIAEPRSPKYKMKAGDKMINPENRIVQTEDYIQKFIEQKSRKLEAFVCVG